MTTEMTTLIGQLNIVQGNWRGDTPNQVAVREPKSAGAPGAGKGDLFVLVEVLGVKPDYEALEQKLAGLIRDTYYPHRGSITASLRRALQAAGDQLYQRNGQVEVEERVVVGVVALVMSGEDAFVAQLGPAALFAILGDHIQRYPSRSIWLDETLPAGSKKAKRDADAESESALGLRPVVEPNLYHLRVSPQDVLVLADSRLTGQLSLDQVVQAANADTIKTIIKNLGRAVQDDDGSALALMVVEEAPSTFGTLLKRPTTSRPGPHVEAELMPIDQDNPQDEPGLMAQSMAMTESLIKKPAHWLGGLTPKKTDPVAANRVDQPQPWPADAPPSTPAKRSRPPTPEPDDFELHPARGAKVMTSMAHGSNFEPEVHQTQSVAANLLRWLGIIVLMPIMLLGRGVHIFLSLFHRSSDEDEPRVAGRRANQSQHQAPAISWTLLRNIAIAIPLVVALIVVVIYWQQGRLREAEYQEFVVGAQNKVEQAQNADASTAIGLMSEAEALLAEAEKIKPTQPEISEMRQKMAEQADVSGKVERLYYVPQLRQYTDPGTNLKGLTVQGVELYVLDTGTDRVFHHRLNDVGEALLADDDSLLVTTRGQTIDDINVGEMAGMTWMPAGGNRQTSDLVILNSAGLLEYNPSWGITTAAIAKPDKVVAPAAVDSYFGNFYVLDPPANKLWRYLPTADGYNTPPQSYFPDDSPVDLSSAVDLAIDGAVYILYKDGRISKFEAGKPVGFNLTGLDKPLSNPAAIYTAPNESVQHLYVADTGNRRIVQLNKDGSFMRQFKPREDEGVTFANLQDIFVDEIGGRIYLLDSNNLYLANIPTEQP